MTSLSRKQVFARFNGLYKNYYDTVSDACYYCGLPADTYDHCPPLGWVHSLGSEYFLERNVKFYRVCCCRECNGLLGMAKKFTPSSRRGLLKVKLKAKYGKHLGREKWTESEMDEFGPVLRSYIEQYGDLAELTRQRLAWPKFGCREEHAQYSVFDDSPPEQAGLQDSNPSSLTESDLKEIYSIWSKP